MTENQNMSLRKTSKVLICALIALVFSFSLTTFAYADTETGASDSGATETESAVAAETTETATGNESTGSNDQASADQSGDKATSSTDSTNKNDVVDKTDSSDKADTTNKVENAISHPVNKPTKAGWMQDADGSWYYFISTTANPSTGWIKLKKTWYYLDPAENGKMATGLFNDGRANYIASTSGAMQASKWVKLGSDWYYATKSGALKTGWLKSGGKWYWLQADKQGLMAANQWITDNNKQYYLTSSGAMKTGWVKDGSDWYYTNKSGAKITNGWQKVSGKWYWLQGDLTGDEKGKMAANKWITDRDKQYYLSGTGAMKTGWVQDGSDWYYTNKSGAKIVNGWQKVSGKWYWLQGDLTGDEKGKMIANATKTIDGKLYSFAASGAMRANTAVDLEDSKVGYAASSGAITQIGVKKDGKTILQDASGKTLTGWQKLAGVWFYGDEGGVAHTGWLELNGKKYWMDASGVMATGLRKIDGKNYVFASSGVYLPVSAAHAEVFELAIKELEKCTNASMTKEQKLRAAFNYVRDSFREYNPRIPHMQGAGWEVVYAKDIFIGRGGNCFSYGAAFAFMAKAIGYDNVYACHDGHGFAEIDGLVYDPEWEKNHRSVNCFGRTYTAPGAAGYMQRTASSPAWRYVHL